jgi:hypothetical protein
MPNAKGKGKERGRKKKQNSKINQDEIKKMKKQRHETPQNKSPRKQDPSMIKYARKDPPASTAPCTPLPCPGHEIV